MALTRKFLNALGIESEKQDEIIDQHTSTINEIKEERDKAKSEVEKLKKENEDLKPVKEKLEKAEKELEDLKSESGSDEYKEKYEKLQAEYDQYKADIDAKALKEKKEAIYKRYLSEAGIPEKRFDAVIRLSGEDISKIELDDDGKEKDGDSIKKGIEENWSDYVATSGKKGADTPNPPENNGDGGKEKSRAAMIAEKYHDELYGKSKEE